VAGRAGALDQDVQVGQAVLQRLETADGLAELHPVAGVGDGQLEGAGRGAGLFGG